MALDNDTLITIIACQLDRSILKYENSHPDTQNGIRKAKTFRKAERIAAAIREAEQFQWTMSE